MPDGSSSLAPVMMPGPKLAKYFLIHQLLKIGDTITVTKHHSLPKQ
jgi:hypothetical protein